MVPPHPQRRSRLSGSTIPTLASSTRQQLRARLLRICNGLPKFIAALLMTCALLSVTTPVRAELSHFSHDIPSQTDDSQLERAAARGNAQAQYILGAMLMVRAEHEERSGWQTKARIYYKQAAVWFHKASASGHGRAQFSLGLLQRNGLTGKRDPAGALRWLRTAANQNVPDALFLMGVMAAGGEGMRRDRNRALDLLTQAGTIFLNEGRSDWTLEVSRTINQVAPGHPAATELAEAARQLNSRTGATPNGFSTGTAWIAAPGYAVTNLHVVQGHTTISLVHPDGSYVPATVAASDEDSDLVLLAVEDPCVLPPALPLAAETPGLGAEVFTVGFPQVAIMGSSPKLSVGRITGDTGVGGDPRTMTISVPVARGNSGGPLINLRGEVVGVVQAMIDTAEVYRSTGELLENVNYAIHIRLLQQLIDQVPSKTPGISVWIKNLVGKSCPPVNEPKSANLEIHATRAQVSTLLVVAE
ncbi:peptidase S1 and S6, chymotrypsin/Hap [Desulfovibrio ferrophilus]|uniref:Peptidase S1 and S6, chymotrypsin/Hap n=2 Tax=Desulfovibrio ferrophilus TaxID=241368 RepID=A0A2Z6AZV3_9BACT|nr:peptidase S1 and S6, chymotrypsin/Hap [Desulfovibrio ferrophilus]